MNYQLTTRSKLFFNNRKLLKTNNLIEKSVLCTVCYCYRSSDLFRTNYCCSTLKIHKQRRVCDTCVHQHVLSKLYSCLTSSITCPEHSCSIVYSQSAICEILLRYKSHQLLDDYLREQQWQGKSDEWIKRFATRCPGCQVPIEKNGGCDEMICIRCQTHFYWSKAKRYFQTNSKQKQYEQFIVCHPFFTGLLFVVFLLFVILCTVIYFK